MIHWQVKISCDYSKTDIPQDFLAPIPHPVLHTYILENSAEIDPERTRPCVIICPGGGYAMTSEREGEHIALRLNALGFHACVLKYSTVPANPHESFPGAFPLSLTELAASVAYMRANAEKLYIDPERICVMGFSAGGHLAASLGVFWDSALMKDLLAKGVIPAVTDVEQVKPNAQILCYPVITSGEFAHQGSFHTLLGDRYEELCALMSLENQVTAVTPPAFIWHTYEDDAVPVENSLFFAAALRRKQIPFELHIYQKGVHGLAAANSETSCSGGRTIQPQCQNWIDMAALWLRSL
jgi:acetyl esterase/lipase